VAGAVFIASRRPGPKPAPVATARAAPVAREGLSPKVAPVSTPGVPAVAAEGDTFSRARKSVVTVIAKHSFEKGFATGSGFFVDAQGRVVTNYHVVKQSDYQQVLLPGSKQPVDARIISQDKEADLALLQTYVTPPVPVAPMIPVSTELKMGDTVYALGSPAGPELAVSLSRGIVSTDRPRTFGEYSFIQHDAAVNPGNSGGPLLNGRGEVVGMNTAKVKGTEGISFAIPIEDVRRFIEVAR
jgi:S1-C subfamily serine protease